MALASGSAWGRSFLSMASSRVWRRAFSRWSSPTRAWASAASSVRRSLRAFSASPRRLAALIRGAMRKATSTAFPVYPTASARSLSPTQEEAGMRARPSFTKARFQPQRGATSAMVPTAARSAYSRGGGRPRRSWRAQRRRKATPPPWASP